MLRKDRPDDQLCYYQPGVGTYFNPGIVSPLLRSMAKLLDLAFAWYLDAHVIGGYNFLMDNYRDGDRICLFGFSRGAYIARSLAGALHKIGLLSKDNVEQVPFAYRLYKRRDAEGIALAAGLKKTFSRDVKIEFVGVWDTVASVGVILGRDLPFTYSNKAVKRFRQALSLDERRIRFQPNPYHRPAPNAEAAAGDPSHSTPIQGTSTSIQPLPQPGLISRIFGRSKEKLVIPDVEEDGLDTDVLEVWFSGCHEDIGGGSVPDSKVLNLAQIPLQWMVKEVRKSGCGILFDDEALLRLENPIPFLAEVETEDTPGDLDSVLALEPIYDQLSINWAWWILEVLLLSNVYQDEKYRWHREYRINFGRGRVIRDVQPFFHRTVKLRTRSSLRYKPKAGWKLGSEVYVD